MERPPNTKTLIDGQSVSECGKKVSRSGLFFRGPGVCRSVEGGAVFRNQLSARFEVEPPVAGAEHENLNGLFGRHVDPSVVA